MPTLKLEQDINPFGIDICVDHATPPRAWLDLDALPRLEPHLLGRPVLDVPDIVKRLCGICPTPHHLTGVRALEDLVGISTIPPTAMLIRLLLHHASVIDTFSPRLLGTNRELAIHARSTAKLLLRIVGCPGHFPDVAVVGGVRARADDSYREQAEQSLATLIIELEQADIPAIPVPRWDGGVDLRVEPHPLGDSIRAGEKIISVQQWPAVIHESHPGQADCRPRIALDHSNEQGQLWRTGPAIRHGGAGVAALVASCCAAQDLLAREELWSDEIQLPIEFDRNVTGVGVGLIDGPRGVLAHLYEAHNGVLEHCQILTPTAQNAAWLEDMLSTAIARYQADHAHLLPELESAIRLADPCLPCTHAPAGMMDIKIHDQSGRR